MTTTYDKFVFDEIRRIGKAWKDKNPNTPSDPEFWFEKIGEMSWRRLVDDKSVRQILLEIGVNPDDYGEGPAPLPPIPVPPPSSELNVWPRVGLSIAGLMVGSAHNIPETVRIYQDLGVQVTRVNLLSALWPGVDTLPFTKLANGKWDLYQWNQVYFDRLIEVRDRMNSAGIVVQWTNYELYSWSDRKPGSQQDGTPWRNNVNGVNWVEDDSMFDILPEEWSRNWITKVVPYLNLNVNPFEIGNEFPEKGLHYRVKDLVKAVNPTALIQVNRNEDTPGQYKNMKIGRDFDFIAFHGNKLKVKSDLNRVYSREPEFKTFNEFFDECPHDPKRIIFSSDGARSSSDPVNTYNWDALAEFVQEIKRKGCSFEHQSRAKMTPAPNHHMIETDWFRRIRG